MSSHRRLRLRVALVAVVLAVAALVTPVSIGEAHTCTPDATVNVTGRLVLPRASGLAIVGLPDRAIRAMPIPPSQGIATGVAQAPDGTVLAVPRFWRPPDHKVGGQDILLVDPTTGAPKLTMERGQPGEVLGSPSWMPDGSLLYERRVLSGSNEAVRIERAHPGQPGQVLAENAYSPSASPDGTLMALIRFAGTDRLYVRGIDGGPERLLADRPEMLAIAFPSFSPDGTWIAFTAASDPAQMRNRSPALGREVALASGPLDALLGKLVGVGVGASRLGASTARAHGAPWDVWVVRPDGTDLRQVTSFADDDSSVAWSPDGRWLATFSSEAIHVVALDGSETYCVASEGGYGAFEWLP